MKIAIIGAGISGLGAAWLLNPMHDITVYEPNPYAGGHSRTIDVMVGGKNVPVDTGFIVYNERNYPLLTDLFKHLDVPTIESDMSFGVSIGGGWLEYGSKSMFAQKKNLSRISFWTMIADIITFNKDALKFIGNREDMTMGECLDGMKMGEWFRRFYLQAMGAAIWSCSVQTILDFPASSFLRFFENHGLLTVNDHPQWRTVKGGSREYVTRLIAPFKDKINLDCSVISIERGEGKVIVRDSLGCNDSYDHVIFACHADQALKLIKNPSREERSILGAFRYQENSVVVHSDETFMPKRKACWSSWVYLSDSEKDTNNSVSLSYWMNNLQKLETDIPLFVTLNPGRPPDPALVYDKHMFDHPVFTMQALDAQKKLNDIQGLGNIWHCGAYQRYGFHEDGFMSAVNVAEKLGSRIPWK